MTTGGESVGTSGLGFLPNITGTFDGLQYPTTAGFTGSFSLIGSSGSKAPNADWSGSKSGFNANKSSQIYTDVDRVVPAYVIMYFCIKY